MISGLALVVILLIGGLVATAVFLVRLDQKARAIESQPEVPNPKSNDERI